MRSEEDPRASGAGRDHWLGVELRHLAALSAVAHEGSFRAAADRLGYVQSAISQQIAFLEKLVGMRLIERSRGPKPVALTEGGTVLLAHSDRIVSQFLAAQADLKALTDGLSGTLRVGVPESVGPRLLPLLVSAFRRGGAGVGVTVCESADDEELFDAVASGSLDVAFGNPPLPAGPVECEELVRGTYVLLVRRGTPLAVRGEVSSLEDLAALPLIGRSRSRVMARLEDELRAGGLEPRFIVRSDVSTTTQALVGAGVGAAVLPRLAVDASDPATASVELGGLLAPWRLALCWHRDRRHVPAVASFCKVAREVCGALTTAHDPGKPGVV